MNRREFADREYRNEFSKSFLASTVATQIRVLREARRLTQAALAGRAGMRQSRISAMEDVNYESWSIKTLQRLAEALDVALIVRFESFGNLLAEAETISRDILDKPSFSADPAFGPSVAPSVLPPLSSQSPSGGKGSNS